MNIHRYIIYVILHTLVFKVLKVTFHLTFVFSALDEDYWRVRQMPLRIESDCLILWPSQDSWVANDVFFA